MFDKNVFMAKYIFILHQPSLWNMLRDMKKKKMFGVYHHV